MTFAPRLDALLPAQRALWPELAAVPHRLILGAARALFGPAFNPLVAQKALTYFEGGDLATLSHQARQRLVAEAGHDLDIPTLPLAADRLD